MMMMAGIKEQLTSFLPDLFRDVARHRPMQQLPVNFWGDTKHTFMVIRCIRLYDMMQKNKSACCINLLVTVIFIPKGLRNKVKCPIFVTHAITSQLSF